MTTAAADTETPALTQPTYRPDIDGLRAIAVLSVVVFHAFPAMFSGGFVGVDMFFVISGYLITGIIGQGLERGRFGFLEFYGRRIRRIFPTLILVLLCSLLAGWYLLLADEYAQLGQHVAAGAGFLSNLVLWAQSGYFDSASDYKPLLHLWSLGIEEQFYIVWPLVMWAAHRLNIRFAWVAGLALPVSFALNVNLVTTQPISAFYLPYCRVWELLVGALVAVYAGHSTSQRWPAVCQSHNALATIGVLLLALGASLLDKNSLFPGWWALLPTLGAALLISARDSWFNRTVLSHRVLVWFGLISYPLYLWHWPLLSFARILQNGEVGIGLRVALMALAVLLAFLTYQGIEKHLRHQGRKVTIVLLLGMSISGLAGWNIYQREGLDFRYRDIMKQSPDMLRDFASWTDKGMYPVGNCEPGFVFPNAQVCLQSVEGSPPDTVVFGDSHAFHAYWGIARALGHEGHTVKLVGRGGCNFALYNNDGDCDRTFNQQLQWMATDSNVQTVFVVHRLVLQNEASDADVGDYRQRMDTLFRTLVQAKKRVVYLFSVPEVRINPQLCGSELPFGRKADRSGCEFPLSRELALQKLNREVVAELLTAHPNVIVFDPADVLCLDGMCKSMRDGKTLWMDANHISESASYLQGEAIARGIGLN